MTFHSILDGQQFTEVELIVLHFLDEQLSIYYGQEHSVVGINDIGVGLLIQISIIKAIAATLCAKGVIFSKSTDCADGWTRELIYFVNQKDMVAG